MPQEPGAFTIEDDMRERYDEFKKEFPESDSGADAMLYDDEQLRNKLTRLAFWAGIFDDFTSRHDQLKDPWFWYELLGAKSEADKLLAEFTRIRSARNASAAPSAKPAPAKPNVVEQAQREVRIMQITTNTQRNKMTDLMTLRNIPSYGLGQPFLENEPPAEFCGAIHMMCGHSTTRGRCCKKMAHSIEVRDTLHQCHYCGQMFGR
jgi:hypothetical protein